MVLVCKIPSNGKVGGGEDDVKFFIISCVVNGISSKFVVSVDCSTLLEAGEVLIVVSSTNVVDGINSGSSSVVISGISLESTVVSKSENILFLLTSHFH